jgi:Glycosyl transferases group 1
MGKLPESVCFYCADQNTHRDRSRGITRYTLGLLSHLRDTKQIKLAALTSRSSVALPDGIEQHTLPFRTDHLIGRLAADHLHSFFAKKGPGEIWHYPKGFLPLGPQVKSKKVGTVADVMIQFDADHHPESRSRAAFTYWIAVLKHSVAAFDLILTYTDFSRRAIQEFCDRYKLRCPPIVVTYLGVEIEGGNEVRAGQKGDYVVHLASKLPYKATSWLLEQWAALTERRTDLPVLKLVGDLDTRATALFSRMKNVSLEPSLPRPQLEELIANARALLLPSEIEGFGIPAVEAYLLGTPVAFARETSLEEVVGESPGGFQREPDSFQTALATVLNMERDAIEKKAVELERRFHWNDTVRRTLEAYQVVASL